MFTDIISEIPREDYSCKNNIGTLVFEFNRFESILKQEIKEKILKHSFISINAENEDGIDSSDILKIRNVKSLRLIINLESYNESILGKLINKECKITFILDHKQQIDYTSGIEPFKRNIFINPFLTKPKSNLYIYFSNTDELPPFETKLNVHSKYEIIRRNATILFDEFILPEFFIYNNSLLDECYKSIFIINTLCSLSSNSKLKDKNYCIDIRGYKSYEYIIETQTIDQISGINISNLFNLYSWVYEEEKIIDTRLNIVRNLITLNPPLKIDELLRILAQEDFLNSAKHQFNLIVQGSIKEHFDNLEKVKQNIQNYVTNVDDYISKVTVSINAVAIGILGFLISTGSKLLELDSTAMIFFLAVILIYVLFIRFVYFTNIKDSKDLAVKNINNFKETVYNRLKIIDKETAAKQLDEPINKTSSRFDKLYNSYSITLMVISVLIALYLITVVSPTLIKDLLIYILFLFT